VRYKIAGFYLLTISTCFIIIFSSITQSNPSYHNNTSTASKITFLTTPFHPIKNTYSGAIHYVGGTGTGNYSKIQAAIDNATDGDIVHVYSGIYNEFINIKKQIHLIGEDKHTTIIRGNNLSTLICISDQYVIIENFTIEDFGRQYDDYGICITENHAIINNNNFHKVYYNGGACIGILSASYITISNNNISGYPTELSKTIGIYADKKGKYLTIENNTFYRVITGGIHVYDIQNSSISNNSFYQGGGISIKGSWSRNNHIFNNQIIEAIIPIDIKSHDLVVKNNLIQGTKEACYLQGSSPTIITNNSINDAKIIIEDANGITIKYNQFQNNSIYVINSYKNEISKNNFYNIKIKCRYKVIDYNSPYSTIHLPPFNNWKNNYWERLRIIPKPIPGMILLFEETLLAYFLNIGIPWIEFDKIPASKPIKIGG
jgi:hypothetical protein